MELGGYFSIKRNAVSIFGDTFLAVDQVVPYCKALLEVFRCAACPPSPINSTPNTSYTALQVAVMRCLALHPVQFSLAITCRTLCAVALALRSNNATLHTLLSHCQDASAGQAFITSATIGCKHPCGIPTAEPSCRDYGARIDRQKARLMWMVEDMGTDKFRELVAEYIGGAALRKGIHPKVCKTSSAFYPPAAAAYIRTDS